jgi:hypothetical protein
METPAITEPATKVQASHGKPVRPIAGPLISPRVTAGPADRAFTENVDRNSGRNHEREQ